MVSKRDKINQNSDKKPSGSKMGKIGAKSVKETTTKEGEENEISNGDQTPLSNDLNLKYHSN